MRAVDVELLALALNRWAPEHARAARVLEGLVNGDQPWALPWSVAHQFLERVSHPHAVARPLDPAEAAGFLELVLSSPSAHALGPTPRHAAALREVLAMAPGEVGPDGGYETAALLREHGVREILSRDAGLRRFPFLTLIDPLSGAVDPGGRRRYRMLRGPRVEDAR